MRPLPSVLRSRLSLPGSLDLEKTMSNVNCDKEEVWEGLGAGGEGDDRG